MQSHGMIINHSIVSGWHTDVAAVLLQKVQILIGLLRL